VKLDVDASTLELIVNIFTPLAAAAASTDYGALANWSSQQEFCCRGSVVSYIDPFILHTLYAVSSIASGIGQCHPLAAGQ